MKSRIVLLVVGFVAAALVCLAACDDGSGNSGKEKEPTDVSDRGTDVQEQESDGAALDAEQDVYKPTEMCTNAADKAIIDPDREGVSDKAKECGLACLGQPDPVACSMPCVIENTGISEGCAGCYAEMIYCSIVHCVLQCASNPDAEPCIQCQDKNNCYDDFYYCSGLPPRDH